jgi:hypothetical protein
VEWQNGGMAEWYFTTYLIYPAIFMVHADDDTNGRNGRMAGWWNGRMAEWRNGILLHT